MNYKNTTVKICSSCNVKKLKACAANYKSTFLDCSICQKAVIYNSTILCSICDHWVHQNCTKLTKDDIKMMENSNASWSCDKCCCDIFPFSQIDANELENVVNPLFKRNPPIRAVPLPKTKCFSCKNPVPRINYKNKTIIYNNETIKLCKTCGDNQSRLKHENVEYLDCTICTKTVNYESIVVHYANTGFIQIVQN